jgi:DNA-binding HxlR family transcriptional regulator
VVGRRDHGPRRAAASLQQLLERIGGISKKMLTQTLHKLERNGLVEREAPVYALTGLGASLLSVVGALACWAEEHTDALLEALASVA